MKTSLIIALVCLASASTAFGHTYYGTEEFGSDTAGKAIFEMLTHSGEIWWTLNATNIKGLHTVELVRETGAKFVTVAVLHKFKAAPSVTGTKTFTGVVGYGDISPSFPDVYSLVKVSCPGELCVRIKSNSGEIFSKIAYDAKGGSTPCLEASVPHSPPIACNYTGKYRIKPYKPSCAKKFISHSLFCSNYDVNLRTIAQAAGGRTAWNINAKGKVNTAIVASKPGCTSPKKKLTAPMGNGAPFLSASGAFKIMSVQNSFCDLVYLVASGNKPQLATKNDCTGMYMTNWKGGDAVNKQFTLVKMT